MGRRGGDRVTDMPPEKHIFFVPLSYVSALSGSSPQAGWSDFH